ncbi:hypothetical protein OGAPHI_002322 [Ogataea philodendri]|uniref:Mannosyltransferase n=1 Tax=Ogataea philodendri TaxID=1378263 RepID=A0A9P8T6X8_9ASCO|nr:uncharacterized protein OGAPHI_002322 [Ogataea philodendri]KAH3668568.1 hypothetical protein OGAPHI_002322 [Ogataea philodendri]
MFLVKPVFLAVLTLGLLVVIPFGCINSESSPRSLFTSTENKLLKHSPYTSGPIESSIWQFWDKDEHVPEEARPLMERWQSVNSPQYTYNYLTLYGVESKLGYCFKDVPEVLKALDSLPHFQLKYEFMKYLLIYCEGGIYADINTDLFKPVRHWFKQPMVDTELLVGVQSDHNADNWHELYNRRLTFGTNIFAAKQYHPFLAKLIGRITDYILKSQKQIQAADWKKRLETLDVASEPVGSFTGPSMFTDVLLEYLNTKDWKFYFNTAREEQVFLFPSSDSATRKDSTGRTVKQGPTIHGPPNSEGHTFSYRFFTMAVEPAQIDSTVVLPQISFNGLIETEKVIPKDQHDDDDEITRGYLSYYYARSINI